MKNSIIGIIADTGEISVSGSAKTRLGQHNFTYNSSTAFTLLLGMLLIVVCVCCSENGTTTSANFGQVRFALDDSGLEDATPAYILLTIEDDAGAAVYTQHRLDLIEFGAGYRTANLSLPVGNYVITEYLVLGEDDLDILGVPLEGSNYAHLVSDPLPIQFSVGADNVLNLTIEVLPTLEADPIDFGFQNFGFVIVDYIEFRMSVQGIFDTGIEFVDAQMSIVSGAGTNVTFDVTDGLVDEYSVINDSDTYTVIVEKPNFETFRQSFTADELEGFLILPFDVLLTPVALTLWNRLGSSDELENSEVGPSLVTRGYSYFEPGMDGGALTLSPDASYSNSGRYNNAVLEDVPAVVDSESGTIVAVFKYTKDPVAYSTGVYRIFDGSYGLSAGITLHVLAAIGNLPLDTLFFSVSMEGTAATIQVPIDGVLQMDTWYTISAVWDRAGIGSSQETMQLFVDNQKVGSSTENSWGTTTGQLADIGGGNDSQIAQSFYVDDIKVYDGALLLGE